MKRQKVSRSAPFLQSRIPTEPIYSPPLSEEQASSVLACRMVALMETRGINPSRKTGLSDLAWKLAITFFPGMTVAGSTQNRKSGRGKKRASAKKGGRPSLGIDAVRLVSDVDRRKAQLGFQPAMRSSVVRKICNALSRQAPYRAHVKKANDKTEEGGGRLAVQYYKYQSKLRETPAYLSWAGDLMCARHDTGRCFEIGNLEVAEIANLPKLCRGPKNCEFYNKAQRCLDILSASSRPIIPAIDQTAFYEALANKKRAERILTKAKRLLAKKTSTKRRSRAV